MSYAAIPVIAAVEDNLGSAFNILQDKIGSSDDQTVFGYLQGIQSSANSISTKADNIQDDISTVSSQISALSATSGAVKRVQRGFVEGGRTGHLELGVYLSFNRMYSSASYIDVTIDAVDMNKTFVVVDAMRNVPLVPN